jgi:hypothetical protein
VGYHGEADIGIGVFGGRDIHLLIYRNFIVFFLLLLLLLSMFYLILFFLLILIIIKNIIMIDELLEEVLHLVSLPHLPLFILGAGRS